MSINRAEQGWPEDAAQPIALYRVHVGYTRKGNDRYVRFASLESARKFCSEVFDKTGKVLAIVQA